MAPPIFEEIATRFRVIIPTVPVGPTVVDATEQAIIISLKQGPGHAHAAEVITHESGPAGRLFDDDTNKQKLVALGERWRRDVHVRIRSDWGEVCFAPDKRGRWHHPLFESSSPYFSCHHCEQTFPGAAVAEALWHCPSPDCDGSPIDIHSADAPSQTII